MEERQGSITHFIEELRSRDKTKRDEAADIIWRRYSCELLELARQRLAPRIRRREDEEDVVQNMYNSFCRRMQNGDFSLDNRDDLWKLLVTMTINKARKAANKHTRKRRSVSSERQDPARNDGDSAVRADPVELVCHTGPNPVIVAELTDMLERLLMALTQSKLRTIVVLKLEGRTNDEIADKLHCSVRTIERKWVLIRDKWNEVAE